MVEPSSLELAPVGVTLLGVLQLEHHVGPLEDRRFVLERALWIPGESAGEGPLPGRPRQELQTIVSALLCLSLSAFLLDPDRFLFALPAEECAGGQESGGCVVEPRGWGGVGSPTCCQGVSQSSSSEVSSGRRGRRGVSDSARFLGADVVVGCCSVSVVTP